MSVIVLGRGPMISYLLSSLKKSDITIDALWYQDELKFLDENTINEIKSIVSESKIVENVNSNQKLLDLIPKYSSKFILSFCFTRIISEDVIKKTDFINCHTALLPKYRGRHPIPWMIINGEKEGGITFHKISSGVDEGDILAQYSFDIGEDDNYQIVLDKACSLVLENSGQFCRNYLNDSIKPIKQNEKEATYIKMRSPEDGLIDWDLSAENIKRLVNAVSSPLPGAYSYLKSNKVIFEEVKVINDIQIQESTSLGECILYEGRKLILTKSGAIEPIRIFDKSRKNDYLPFLAVGDIFSSNED